MRANTELYSNTDVSSQAVQEYKFIIYVVSLFKPISLGENLMEYLASKFFLKITSPAKLSKTIAEKSYSQTNSMGSGESYKSVAYGLGFSRAFFNIYP